MELALNKEDVVAERTLWDMQDDFHKTTSETRREEIRNEIRAAGFGGVANTIGLETPQPAYLHTMTAWKSFLAWLGIGRHVAVCGFDLHTEPLPPACPDCQARTGRRAASPRRP